MIRDAEIKDAKSIASLWNWMIQDTLATFTTEEKSLEDIENLVEARQSGFFVAEDAEGVTGFVTFGPFRAGPGYGATCEHTVIVAPDSQRQETGRALMAQAMRSAAKQGYHVMVGAISSANLQAVRFHEKLGFDEVGRMPEVGRKAGCWLDLILVQKILD